MPQEMIWVSASSAISTGSATAQAYIPSGQWILEKYSVIVAGSGDGYVTVSHLKEGQSSSFFGGLPFFPAKNLSEGEPMITVEGGQSIRAQCTGATNGTSLGITLWLRRAN